MTAASNLAWMCLCGSVSFHLRKDGRLECAGCKHYVAAASWGFALATEGVGAEAGASAPAGAGVGVGVVAVGLGGEVAGGGDIPFEDGVGVDLSVETLH